MLIATGDDADLYAGSFPLPLLGLVAVLKCAVAAGVALRPGDEPSRRAVRGTLRSAGALLSQLYDRNGRRPFVDVAAFHVAGPFVLETLEGIDASEQREEEDGEEDDEFAPSVVAAAPSPGPAVPAQPQAIMRSDGARRTAALLAAAPCLVPFRTRAEAFQRAVAAEREQYRVEDMGWGGGYPTRTFVTIRRGAVLEDAFAALRGKREELKGPIRVQFVSDFGMPEAGVDGGGLFKEFLEELVKEGFSPSKGLFASTSEGQLYPNPAAVQLGLEGLEILEFLGRVLGKALLEGILVELPLATFFLQKLLGRRCELRDLETMDPELARGLAELRRFPPEVIDSLGLTFTVTDTSTGVLREVELMEGGASVAVTSTNAIEYVHRMADYRLNRQLGRLAGAFAAGLHALLPRRLLAAFSAAELQCLISGGRQGLDVADLAAHVQFGPGYSAQHPVVLRLWAALERMTPGEQGAFLRFVTSCPRPPLLGFKYLTPPLSVQLVQMSGQEADADAQERLPTSSTCANLLKLPPYKDLETMTSKLKYAVSAGAGFDLS